jgi:hypothetical protein
LTALARATQGAEAASEYQIKAVFLFNFTRFVEWPPQAFASPSEPFVIGVLGEDPFGSRLDDVVRNERVGEHPLIIRRFHKLEDIGNCKVLFMDRSESAKVGQAIAGLNNGSVLTVSELDGSAERGVMIEFATENNHIRLRINAEGARAAGLVVSSKLLHLAEIVGTKSGN